MHEERNGAPDERGAPLTPPNLLKVVYAEFFWLISPKACKLAAAGKSLGQYVA